MKNEIAGVRIPDSHLAVEATELAREMSAPFLFNHVMRTYLFGALLAKRRGLELDVELFYLGAALHDLGLAERFRGPERYEVEGANAASAFLKQHGVPEETIGVVWEAIALHTVRGVPPYKRPEVALLHVGTIMDIMGEDLKELSADEVNEVLQAYPRLDFKRAFPQAIADMLASKPETAFYNFTADIAERLIPGFHAPNFHDIIQAAPFKE
ncbi:phosphohydrolase [Sorangium cellulosum]|nr:phosphohydrolase [Sorangium cellulosum]